MDVLVAGAIEIVGGKEGYHAKRKIIKTLRIAMILLVNLRFWTISLVVTGCLASRALVGAAEGKPEPLSWLLKRLDLIPLERLGATLIDSSTGFLELFLDEPRL